MVSVAPVRLAHNPRVLWFDPLELSLTRDEAIVVETARGLEFATMADDILEVPDEAIEELPSPLKPVVRVATEEDMAKASELDERGREALPLFKELAAEFCPDMHPVSVEFLLDESKAVFYFEAEERVDFRTLVRELASAFHIRVDMHQIGARDKARLIGGLGHCGQEICCRRLGGQFNPVSIRMAKDQDLSLNPTKISGLCGRLMCCLRYESEVYKEFKSRTPKMGATVTTPAGPAKVVGLDALKEIVTVAVPDEPPIRVALTGFAAPEEGKRPKVITEEGWQEAVERTASQLHGRLVSVGVTPIEPKKPESKEETAEAEEPPKRSRRRGRRSRNREEGESPSTEAAAKPTGEKRGAKAAQSAKAAQNAKERPTVTRRKRQKPDQAKAAKPAANRREETAPARRARRRTTITQPEGEAASTTKTRTTEHSRPESGEGRKPRPRPGHRSSGLRAPHEGTDGADRGKENR